MTQPIVRCVNQDTLPRLKTSQRFVQYLQDDPSVFRPQPTMRMGTFRAVTVTPAAV